MVRFIHAADLHLDSPFKGLKNIPEELLRKIKDSTFESLRNIVDTALKENVAFVLLAGDIYDIDDRSIKAQVFLKKEMQRLKDNNIDVYLIHGNHDFLTNEEMHLSLPENVTVYSNEVETVLIETAEGESVAISGFSYGSKWIEERKIRDYPSRKPGVDYHIGLLHGYLEGHTSSHARYAPFSLAELKEKNYDYWALGHIHKRQQLSKHPLAYYSGNAQGRHKNEEGEKGCLLVELSSSNHTAQFIPTAVIQWKTVSVDVTSQHSMDVIFDQVKNQLSEHIASNCLIYLNLRVSADTPQTIIQKLEDEDFYQAFHQITADSFRYIVSSKASIDFNGNSGISLEKTFPQAWEKAVDEVTSETVFNELTDDLHGSRVFARYLNERDEIYRKEILSRANTLLLQDLGEGEGIINDN